MKMNNFKIILLLFILFGLKEASPAKPVNHMFIQI